MLVDVRHDRPFQRYLDEREQRLYDDLRPPIAHAMRLQMSRGGIYAQTYLRERATPILLRHYEAIYRDAYRTTGAQVSKQEEPKSESAFMAAQRAWLQSESAARVQGISDTVRDQIVEIVSAGVAAGRSNDRIAADLYRDIPDLSRTRAATIARTETHGAALEAIDESLKYKDLDVLEKTWLTANDDRVRPSHRAVNGLTVKYDEPFPVGDSMMLRPGDDSLGAGAEEIVNCRCSIIFRTSQSAPLPGEEPGPAPAPTEEALAAVADAAKAYVLSEGARRGVEVLRWIDLDTAALEEETNAGTAGNVGIPEGAWAAMQDPDRSVGLHHNHPSDAAFSAADIGQLERLPGLDEIWAHGQAGSDYLATDAKAGAYNAMNLIDQLHDVWPFPTPPPYWLKRLPRNMIDRVFGHAVSLAVSDNGFFRYTAKLAPDLARTIAANQEDFDLMVGRMKRKIGNPR